MAIPRAKVFRFTFVHFFAGVLSVMFVLTVFLTFKLLTNDNCSCSQEGPRLQYFSKSSDAVNINYESNHKLALLVPFRERFEELMEFAPFIHKFLNQQKIAHDIFILNQADNYRFNRASLINVGYLLTKSNYDYIAMHDVDLLPLNNQLSYVYPHQPFHLASPSLHPRYHYPKFIGGILLINREHFHLVNGMSNRYWGWGLEDDEFYVRLKNANLNVTRPDHISTGINNTFRHIHGKHRKRDTTKCFNQREITRRRDRETGLHDVKYNIINYKKMSIEDAPLTVVNIHLVCNRTATPWCICEQLEPLKKT